MNLLIHSGTLVTATETFQADILIQGERIERIIRTQPGDGTDRDGFEDSATDRFNGDRFSGEHISAEGKYILPGGVDPHTHFALPMFGTISSDDHYTGHKAAAFGGTTTVIDFVSLDEETLAGSIERWHQKAGSLAAVDYGFHMNITRFNPAIAREIPSLLQEGISSLKVFTAYNDRLRLDDGAIFEVMRIAGRHDLLTMLHAENGDVIEILVREALEAGHTDPPWHARTRPAWGAVEAALRGISLAAQAEAPLYLVHMNAAGEVDMLRYGREKHLPVMGETCPQYLFFNDEALSLEDGAKWVCSPPLRRPEDNARLWEGLADGTIQVIGTDHCPFFYDGSRTITYENQQVAIPGKELGKENFSLIPNGLPAVGDRLPVLWTYGVGAGKLTLNQFVALTSTNPAKVFGLYPQKGSLEPGADADLVIWDPQTHLTYGVAHAQHRTDYNLYEGWELIGYPEKVFLRGKVIVDQGSWYGKPGMGRYLYRKPGTLL